MMTISLEQSSEQLMEKIVDPDNLDRAWKKVRSNQGAPGPDGITIDEFPDHCREHWPAIRQHLLEGTYSPSPARRKSIPRCSSLWGRTAANDISPQKRARSQRDGSFDSTNRLTNPDPNLRSGFLGIELWISTKTLCSGRSETGTALYKSRLSSLYRYGSFEILRQSPTRYSNGPSRTESA